jgi:hypothetical protein
MRDRRKKHVITRRTTVQDNALMLRKKIQKEEKIAISKTSCTPKKKVDRFEEGK